MTEVMLSDIALVVDSGQSEDSIRIGNDQLVPTQNCYFIHDDLLTIFIGHITYFDSLISETEVISSKVDVLDTGLLLTIFQVVDLDTLVVQ